MDWVKAFDGAVTVADKNFTIVYMNDKAVSEFQKYGGAALIGKNLLDCHNPDSCEMIKQILETCLPNVYISEKSDGRRKIIHQSCWKEDGIIKGLVEVSVYLSELSEGIS